MSASRTLSHLSVATEGCEARVGHQVTVVDAGPFLLDLVDLVVSAL